MNEWKKEGRLYRKWIGASYAGILSKAEMLNVLFDDAQIQLQDDFVYKKKNKELQEAKMTVLYEVEKTKRKKRGIEINDESMLGLQKLEINP